MNGRSSCTLAYTAFGYCQNLELSQLGFNSERADPLTFCYPLGNGYRNYNPAMMRCQSPDDQSPFALGGINAYTYNLNDPFNRIDPSGRVSFTVRNGSAYRTEFSSRMQARRPTYNLSTNQETAWATIPHKRLPLVLRNAQREYRNLRSMLRLTETIATEQTIESGSVRFMRNHLESLSRRLDHIDARVDRISNSQIFQSGATQGVSEVSQPLSDNPPALSVTSSAPQSSWLADFRTALRNGVARDIINLLAQKVRY